MPKNASPDKADEDKDKFRKRFLQRYSLRLHVSLMLAATLAVGLASSKALLFLGVHSMVWRYPLTMLLMYLAFLAFVRLWLKYVGCLQSSPPASRAVDDSGNIDLGVWPSGSIGGGGSGGSLPFRGGGGSFGGGGASASFGDDADAPVMPAMMPNLGVRTGGGGGGSGGGLGGGKWFDGLDFDADDAWPLVVAIIVLVVVAGGAFAYVLYAGPTVLMDAAFEATLAGSLLRAGRQASQADWVGSVLRETWIPFALVMLAAIAFALAAQHYAPEAQTFFQVLRHFLHG